LHWQEVNPEFFLKKGKNQKKKKKKKDPKILTTEEAQIKHFLITNQKLKQKLFQQGTN